jgi:hypothetical protein
MIEVFRMEVSMVEVFRMEVSMVEVFRMEVSMIEVCRRRSAKPVKHMPLLLFLIEMKGLRSKVLDWILYCKLSLDPMQI